MPCVFATSLNASFGLLLTTLHARIVRARPCQGQRPVILLYRTQLVSPQFLTLCVQDLWLITPEAM